MSGHNEMLAVSEGAAGAEASALGLGSRRLRRQTDGPRSQHSYPFESADPVAMASKLGFHAVTF
jgi:hypothetical protein